VLFNSDRAKDRVLYQLAWPELRRLVYEFHDDGIVELHVNRETGEMIRRGPKTALRPPVTTKTRRECWADQRAGRPIGGRVRLEVDVSSVVMPTTVSRPPSRNLLPHGAEPQPPPAWRRPTGLTASC
jgi:hypothetical protein